MRKLVAIFLLASLSALGADTERRKVRLKFDSVSSAVYYEIEWLADEKPVEQPQIDRIDSLPVDLDYPLSASFFRLRSVGKVGLPGQWSVVYAIAKFLVPKEKPRPKIQFSQKKELKYLQPEELWLDDYDKTIEGKPTLYSFDGAQWFSYKQPLNIVDDGRYRIQYYSLDKEGEKGALKVLDFFVDKRPPRTTLKPAGRVVYRQGVGYLLNGAKLKMAAQDAVSGVKETYYRSGAPDFQPYKGQFGFEGKSGELTTIEYYSVDNAGNTEPTKQRHYQLDNVPPRTRLLNNPANLRRQKFVTLTWKVTDEIMPVSAEVFMNDEVISRQTSSGTVVVVVNRLRSEGAMIKIIVTDALGNRRISRTSL